MGARRNAVHRDDPNRLWRENALIAQRLRDGARQQRRVAGPKRTDPKSIRVARRDRWTCWLCGKAVDRTLRCPDPMAPTMDHVQPESQGGGSHRGNLRLAHAICNQSRGTVEPNLARRLIRMGLNPSKVAAEIERDWAPFRPELP